MITFKKKYTFFSATCIMLLLTGGSTHASAQNKEKTITVEVCNE